MYGSLMVFLMVCVLATAAFGPLVIEAVKSMPVRAISRRRRRARVRGPPGRRATKIQATLKLRRPPEDRPAGALSRTRRRGGTTAKGQTMRSKRADRTDGTEGTSENGGGTGAPDATPGEGVRPGLVRVSSGPLPLERIKVNGHNRVHAEPDIEEMAASVRANGVLQPVGVIQAEGEVDNYVLIFGHLRTAGARRAGLTEIPAIIYMPEGDSSQARRAIVDAAVITENLQRVAPDSAQEADHVANLVAIAGGVEEAAARLGRSASWVRERSYLAAAGAKLRQLVVSKRLPLLHAREICRNVADPTRQDELASDYAADADGSGVRSIDELKDDIKRNQFSLHVVPWRMDVETPGVPGAPACDRCDCNSANRRGLFEAGAVIEPGKGDRTGHNGVRQTAQKQDGPWCLNGRCYTLKRKACEKAVAKAVGPALKAIGEESVSLKNAAVMQAVPEGVEPRVLLSALRSKRADKGDKSDEKDGDGEKSEPKSAKRTKLDEVRRAAYDEHSNLMVDAEKQVDRQLKTALTDDARAALFEIIYSSEEMVAAKHWDEKKREKYGCPPKLAALIRRLVKPDPDNVAKLAMARVAKRGRDTDAYEFGSLSQAARVALFEALGIEAKYPQPREQFVAAKISAAKAELAGAAAAGEGPESEQKPAEKKSPAKKAPAGKVKKSKKKNGAKR